MVSKNGSKDKTLIRHYVTQLPNRVLKTLAGFPRDEKYFVPRAQLKPPAGLSWSEVVPLLFPEVDRWKEELASDKGDKCKASFRFINEVLPFFAEVIFQDGVIWLDRYPNNSASLLLKNIQIRDGLTYLQYAASGRLKIKQGVKETRKSVNIVETKLDEVHKMLSILCNTTSLHMVQDGRVHEGGSVSFFLVMLLVHKLKRMEIICNKWPLFLSVF